MSDHLFSLIKSLSRSEKRHFKLHAPHARNANYLKVFDAIAGQDTYDEKALKKRFAGEKFTGQFHVVKNYLHQQIMKSLRSYHTTLSKDAELKDLLRNIEILFNKELYDLCELELRKARRIAEAYELLHGHMQVEGWERRLAQTRTPHDYNRFKEILGGQDKILKALENSHTYNKLIVDVSDAVIHQRDQTVDNEELLENPQNALTYEARIMHYNAAYFRDVQHDRGDASRGKLKELIDHLDQNPIRKKESPGMYVTCINNYLSHLVYTRHYKEARLTAEKAHMFYDELRITAENRTLLKQILRTYNIELEIYRGSSGLEDHLTFVQHVENFVTENRFKMPKAYLLSFWYQLASIRFDLGEFNESLKWINAILNDGVSAERLDIQCHARFLNLMIHLELNNIFVLRYFVDSTRRFLRKIKEPEPYELVLLRFFSKMGRSEPDEYPQIYDGLAQELFGSKQPMVPAEASDYIDYQGWIDRKVVN